jgi:hypothetical protein
VKLTALEHLIEADVLPTWGNHVRVDHHLEELPRPPARHVRDLSEGDDGPNLFAEGFDGRFGHACGSGALRL